MAPDVVREPTVMVVHRRLPTDSPPRLSCSKGSVAQQTVSSHRWLLFKRWVRTEPLLRIVYSRGRMSRQEEHRTRPCA